MVDAVVLAGSRNNGPLKKCSVAKDEAMIKIGNRHMIEYVIESLCRCKYINRVVIVGPEKDLVAIYHKNKKILITSAGENAIESLQKGIKSLNKACNRVLVVTSDIPLITPEALENFIIQSADENVDVYYPVVPKDIIEKKFPEVERTYVNLKEGVFTGGNIFLINPNIIESCAKKAQEIVDLRKSPIKLCNLLGLPFVIKFIFRCLSIDEIEQKVSSLMNIKGESIISNYPEVGVDVDKPSDLKLVKRVMQKAN